MEAIQNIFCVGRNYAAHIAELNNSKPAEPVWFMKPSHSLVKIEGTQEAQEVALPWEKGAIHYEVELVIQLKEDYLPNTPIDKLVGKVALGIDFTLRDLQSELKTKQLPWLRAKGFKNSAIITPSLPFSTLADIPTTEFSLKVNETTVQVGHISEMIFSISELLDSCWEQFDLRAGDIIFTGTPAGVGQTQAGDFFQLYLNKGCLSEFTVS